MTRVTFRRGARVRRMEKRLENPAPILNQIGLLLVSEAQDRFKAQSFDGRRWQQRAPVNVFGLIADFNRGAKTPPARRFERRPALVDTGRLRSSIAHRVVGRAVEVGSNLDYAAVHQTGGEVESEEITATTQQRLWAWLRDQAPVLKRRLGWLLNKKLRGTRLSSTVPKRQFLGLTRQTRDDIRELIGVVLVERKG